MTRIGHQKFVEERGSGPPMANDENLALIISPCGSAADQKHGLQERQEN